MALHHIHSVIDPRSRSMFSPQTNFIVLENPLSIFDHIPQAECLLPQESFGIENDVLGDDDKHTFTFNDIVCQTPSFASTVSIKIGTKFIQVFRQKSLKLPEKKQTKSVREGGEQAPQADVAQGAHASSHVLIDAIPRPSGSDGIFTKTGSHELRLETKSVLSRNIKLKCDGAKLLALIEAESSTQVKDSESPAEEVVYSGPSTEEYLSKILVVSLMGLCDTDDTIRTESQCLLSRIFRRLGSGPAFEHTNFSCPPSNMNRLTSEISTRMVKSNPRLALPFLKASLEFVRAFNSSPNQKPPVNLQ